MSLRQNQSGFSVFELALLGLVILALGFVGYKVYNHQTATTNSATSVQASSSVQSAKANDVAAAPAISSTTDLTNAMTLLNQTNPGGSNTTDASQLDAQLASF